MVNMVKTVGLVGLGKMGSALARLWIKDGFTVFGFDNNPQVRQQASSYGVKPVNSIEELTQQARIFWIMVPAGQAVDDVIAALRPGLKANDVVIDGGNSHFTDSVRRAADLKKQAIYLLDAGVSGGVQGEEHGYSITIGGMKKIYEGIRPVFAAVAAPLGQGHIGPSGAGHYAKMIHNGIEYALLEAYAEGFALLHDGRYKKLNLAQIAKIWNKAAIIRSYILELSHDMFKEDEDLESIEGRVDQTGMGKWMVEEAHAQNIPVKLVEDSVQLRDQSMQTGGTYADKVIAKLRNIFGGHKLHTKQQQVPQQ